MIVTINCIYVGVNELSLKEAFNVANVAAGFHF